MGFESSCGSGASSAAAANGSTRNEPIIEHADIHIRGLNAIDRNRTGSPPVLARVEALLRTEYESPARPGPSYSATPPSAIVTPGLDSHGSRICAPRVGPEPRDPHDRRPPILSERSSLGTASEGPGNVAGH